MATRAEFVDRDAAIRASPASPARRLALEYGISETHVHRIRGSAPRVPTRRERIAIDAAEGWRAACMEPDEWTHWVANNPLALNDGSVADRPCVDCPLGYAADMRAIGRCNGSPGAVGGRHEHPEEGEDDMNDLRPSGGGSEPGGAGADPAALRDLSPRADLRPQDRPAEGDVDRDRRDPAAGRPLGRDQRQGRLPVLYAGQGHEDMVAGSTRGRASASDRQPAEAEGRR